MATIIPTKGTRDGSASATAYVISDVTTHTIKNDGNVLILVGQGDVETTVTVQGQGSFAGAGLEDLTINMSASGFYPLGPFPIGAYNNAHGYMTVTIDSSSCDVYVVQQ